MISTKQRAFLRTLSNQLDTIFHVGKEGGTAELVDAISEALEKRELIKVNVLNNCDADVKELAQIIAERSHSEVVQVIGKRFVLYRQAREPHIILPNDKKNGNK